MQRNINCIKICAKINKTPAETFCMFVVFVCMLRNAYGDESMSQTCVFEAHEKFHGGQEHVQDNELLGRPRGGSHSDQSVYKTEPVTFPVMIPVISSHSSPHQSLPVPVHPFTDQSPQSQKQSLQSQNQSLQSLSSLSPVSVQSFESRNQSLQSFYSQPQSIHSQCLVRPLGVHQVTQLRKVLSLETSTVKRSSYLRVLQST